MHRRLLRLARTARLPLSIGIAAGLLAGLCGVAQAHLLSATVERAFIGRADLAGAWPFLSALLAVVAVRALLLGVQELACSEVAVRVKQRLRDRLFRHLLKLGPSFSGSQNTGELSAAAVDGIEALDAYYGQYLPQLAVSILVPLTILTVVFPLDPLSGLILLLTAPLIPFFMYMIGRSAEDASARQYSTLGRLSSHLLDSIQGLATLKIFGQSQAQAAIVGRVADRFREVTLKVLQVSFLSAFALELIATVSTAIVAVEVGLRLLYGRMGFQPALFLLILAPEFYMPLRMLGARFHAGMAGTAAARRIFALLDTPPQGGIKASRPAAQMPRGRARTNGPPVMQFENVSFTYPTRDHPALAGINLEIPRGTHTAIVGVSGAGKSTLAGLMLGFMQPTTGHLHYGGTASDEIPLHERRPPIAWVSQAPHLFNDTIAANIKLGRPEASEADVREAARHAHLDEFIATLPEGLGTLVGEGAARLSTGEAQRLALARAFLMNAPILILDEPSSSQDPENEALLEDSLQQLRAGRTVITIAQRLRTIEGADQIIVLDEGRITEGGTHAELLAADGTYAALLRADRLGAGTPEGSGGRAWAPARDGVHERSRAEIEPRGLPFLPTRGLAVLSRLLGFLEGFRWRVALSVLLATLTIASSVSLMGISAWLISAAALHPSIVTLQLAIVGVRFFGIGRAVLRYFERLVSHDVTFRILRNIRVWFYSRLEPLAPARLMDYRAGDLLSRAIADVETLDNLYGRVLSPVISAAMLGAALSAYLWIQRAEGLAIVVAGGFVLAGFAAPALAMGAAAEPGARLIALRGRLRSQLVDGIQGMADIMAYGRGRDWAELIRRSGDEQAAVQRSMARIAAMHTAALSCITGLAVWFVLLLWIPKAAESNANGLLLASFALIVMSSFEAVAGIPQAGQLWPSTRAAARRLFEIVSVPPAVTGGNEPPAEKLGHDSRPTSNGSELRFDHVGFQYPGRSRPALRDVTFSVREGECVAIVGPSGAGKSTLAHLLLRFWEYDAGEIRLGQQSVRSLPADAVRARIGYVSQHPYIFDTSILENLRLARRRPSRADLEQAAHRAALHEFIESLPAGYETLIGEHGAMLSAGQRQRLGLARVILKDAPILVLDEPTANLDAQNEAHILDGLLEFARKRTCLFITHRLRRMEDFDDILVMEHGAIRERGSHGTLLAAGGLYTRLWTLQNGLRLPSGGRLANSL